MVNPKVKEAFRAMKSLGINEETVKPVLKKLLKLYDKNWELIESENFRVLADAIFEVEDAKVEEQKKVEIAVTTAVVNEEAAANGETVRPLKRLRRKYQDPQTSSPDPPVHGTSLIKPKEEPNVSPQRCMQTQSLSIVLAEKPQSQARNSGDAIDPLGKGKENEPLPLQSLPFLEIPDISNQEMTDVSQPTDLSTDNGSSYSRPMHLRDKGKQILNPQHSSRESTPRSRKTSLAVHIEDPKDDFVKPPSSQFFIEPKAEPFTEDFIQLEAPSPIRSSAIKDSVNAKDSVNGEGSVNGNGSDRHREQHISGIGNNGVPAFPSEARVNIVPLKDKRQTSSEVEIASTPCRKVMINLSYDLANQKPDFSPPSLEELLDMVEDRYLKTHEVQVSKYSLMKILKGMCACVLELGHNSRISEKALMQVALVNSEFDSQETLPSIPLLPPCNVPDDYDPLANSVPSDQVDEGNQDDNNCWSLVVRQSELSTVNIGSATDVFDVTKGRERVVISLVNEVNNASLPSFHYITHNAVFEHAYISVSLARTANKTCCSSCFEDCISLSMPCSCSQRGAFAYTKEGLLREEFLKECVSVSRAPEKHSYSCEECPLERAKHEDTVESCKGHLIRKFIKECWVKCGCSKNCGNRVVQQGISRHLQVFMTIDGKGWGLRTLEHLPKGAFVCEYVGEVLTNAELFHRVEQRRRRGEIQSYPLWLDADWGSGVALKDEKALCLDATEYGNVARFVNHRCFDSNLVQIPVELETPDHHYYHVALFTSREVKAMEELTWDYGIDFDDIDHPIKAFSCHCGSKYCRSVKRRRGSRSVGGVSM